MLKFFFFNAVHLSGTKYGCGVGGCGACTVMISTYDPVTKQIQHRPANSCLFPICSLHGAAVTTVEEVGSIKPRIHTIQERLAKCNGSQCGFCTPGKVMSIYALLRNHAEPSMEKIIAALDGRKNQNINLQINHKSPTCCQLRATGQCCLDEEEHIHSGLCNTEEFPPVDPTQEFIFPPELIVGLIDFCCHIFNHTTILCLSGLKKNHHGAYHPIILHPVRIPEMYVVSSTTDGLVIGAACCLAQLRDILMKAVPKLAEEKTKIYQAFLQHLRTLAGEQMRSMASLGGHIVSRASTRELNPISSVGKSVLNLASEGKLWTPCQIPLPDGQNTATENMAKEVIVSVLIPYSMKDDFISAFRQAESQKNALSIVNSGMRILFSPGTDTIVDLSILYGGIGSTILSARKSCEKLIGRQWNDQMLNEACRLVLEEIFLPPSALGRKVEYRRTLLVSFLFRFYLEVLHGLNQMYPFRCAELSQEKMSALGMLQSGIAQGVQIYQLRCPPQDPVGRPIMHQSGIKHTTGEEVYIDDIRPVDGELSLALVTNIKAHTKIMSINASEALQVPGVVDVVTARDVPGENGKDEQAYAEDKVFLASGGVSGPFAPVIYKKRKVSLQVSSCCNQMKISARTVNTEFVASALNLQYNKIMCHMKCVGGAFGGKITKPLLFAVIAAVAANKTGHAVCFALERNMDMLITGRWHPFFGKYKVGFMNDGRIRAADFQCYINGGCTKDEFESVIPCVESGQCIYILNLLVRGHACKTNLPSNTAFRGFEFPQAGLFVETCIVAVATQTDLPHEKVREINMYKRVNLTSFKEKFDAENLWKCWEECLDKPDYYSKKAMKGIAIIPMKFSVGFNATYFHQVTSSNQSLVHIYIDGSVLVTHGGIELGQGIHTKMSHRELKIPLSYIHLCETSTTTVTSGKYTAGSTGTEINARAVQDVCQILWKHLDPIQRDNPNGKWEDWVNLSLCFLLLNYDKPTSDTEKGHAFPYFRFGVSCSENIGTDIVMDACFTINPAIDIGQIEGAFIQGVGLYTLEEIFFSPEGEQLTLGPDTYKIPAICDIPEQFCVYLLPNSCNSIAIYSSKGVGEARFFLGSSVFFAIQDAVAAARKERGLPMDFTPNSPLTVERICMACDDVFTEMVRLFSSLL
uniref:Aldehyde oxidase n=1 Tax=Buteo japonicus TaxID=224669 RepID=A0A8C0BAZ2_9AVES